MKITQTEAEMMTPDKAVKFFHALNKDTLALIDEFYHEDVVFRDPLVEIRGRAALHDYYGKMYQNVRSIVFEFPEVITEDDRQSLIWTMTLSAKGYNGNKPLSVDGTSVIRYDRASGLAVYHRDYFDLGTFVYETLPVLGPMVRFVKRKMADH